MSVSTPRRSRRFQPILAVPSTVKSSGGATWSSQPIKSRPATHDDLDYEEDWDDGRVATTTFYGSLSLDAVTRAPRSYGRLLKGKGKVKEVGDEIKLGDTVLVQTAAPRPSLGVVVAMWGVSIERGEGEGEEEEAETEKMRVRLHWFTQPWELPRVRAKHDHLDNEVYYTLNATAIISPSSIISQCTVVNAPHALSTKAKSAKPPKPSHHYESDDSDEPAPVGQFVCGLALNGLKGLYYKFDWATHLARACAASVAESHVGTVKWEQGALWDVPVEEHAKRGTEAATRTKRRAVKARKGEDASEGSGESEGSGDEYKAPDADAASGDEEPVPASEDEADEGAKGEEDEEDLIPRTPRKRKRQTTSTPRKASASPRKRAVMVTTPGKRARPALAVPTPHSKARARRTQAAVVRPPPPPLTQAHYAALAGLPQDPWLRAMHVLHVAARPDALPCRDEEYSRVLRAVEELVEEGSGGCVYISGVPGTGKTATVHAVVRELKRMAENNESNPFTYVEINGLRIPEPSAAYALLWEAVSGHDVVTEGHLKISPKEALKQLTRHFSSGGRRGPSGHACVVLMDELDQLVTAKQDVVYNFFNWPTLVGSKLVVLAVANTMDLPERVMTGRVRSRLGMIRINFQPYTTPQLEKIVHARLASAKESLPETATAQPVIAPDGVKFAAMKVSSISGDARRVLDICRRAVELVQARRRTARTEDVREVIRVMQNSPTAAYLRELSLHERMMLAALLKCVRRTGVEEIRWGDIITQHLIYASVLPGDDEPARRPSADELGLVLDSLLASRALLMEDGAGAARKAAEERRCVLNLEQTEVERVLGEVGGARWKTALSV